ncbi:MAG: hypothetical protein ACRC62_11345 [Microcoleus sp.]
MSVCKTSIKAFVDVIESKSDLFSDRDWVELNQLASNVPDDDEEIAVAIESWLELASRSQILEAYEELLGASDRSSNFNLNGTLGFGNTKSSTPPDRPSESSKEMLDNAIKNNSPRLNSSPTQQQQP